MKAYPTSQLMMIEMAALLKTLIMILCMFL
jgi:hypothetical protein